METSKVATSGCLTFAAIRGLQYAPSRSVILIKET